MLLSLIHIFHYLLKTWIEFIRFRGFRLKKKEWLQWITGIFFYSLINNFYNILDECIDYIILQYVIVLLDNRSVSYTHLDVYKRQIQTLVSEGYVTGELKKGFPAINITNPDNFVSLLYYFGMLTISGTYKGCLLYTSRCV